VGDIHGCDVALSVLVERLQLTSQDCFVVLGVAVDRRPGSREVLDQLVVLQLSCQRIYLKGNHEEMMLDSIRGHRSTLWLRNGGAATLASYNNLLTNLPEKHLHLLDATQPDWKSATDMCVHANLEPGVALPDQRSVWLRWQKLTGLEFPHPSGKRVLCGHSGVSTNQLAFLNGWICLDTLAHQNGYLTCIETRTGEISQSRQSGTFRTRRRLRNLQS